MAFTSTFTGAQIDAALAAAPVASISYNQITPAVILSTNLSSWTDVATGNASVVVTSPFATGDYKVVGSSMINDSFPASNPSCIVCCCSGISRLAGSLTLGTIRPGDSSQIAVAIDNLKADFILMGDLA